jgi:hypothetical protein
MNQQSANSVPGGSFFSLFWSATPSLQAMCANGSMVRASLTWFQRMSDFFRAMQKGERENGDSSECPAMATRADGDEGDYLCQYKPPSKVTLPPRIPPPREGHETLAAGIVEQYERFIVVDGVFLLPIRLWEDQARPSGIKPDSMSNRFIQYFFIRGLNPVVVPPEQNDKTMSQMLTEGKNWKIKMNKKNKKVGRTFWPQKAAKAFGNSA